MCVCATDRVLYSRTWFILGCACIRVEDWDGAREAFAVASLLMTKTQRAGITL